MSTIDPPSPPYLGPAKFQGDNHNKPIKRIVLHGTVSPCVRGGARAIARYFRELVVRPSSAHYVADPGESVQVVWDSVVAFHAPPNDGSIGYELCDWVAANNGKGPGAAPMERWNDKPHRDMLQIAAEDIARLCLHYDVPIRFIGPVGLRLGRKGICEHSDVSAAWHQTSHWDLGNFPRRRFLEMVKAEARKLKGEPEKPFPRAQARVVLSPSRFDRTPSSLLAAVKSYLPGHNIVLLTEVQNNLRSRALKHLPGIGYVNIEPGVSSECMILYKRWRFAKLWQHAYKLEDEPSGKLGANLPYAAGAILQHQRTGQTLGILLGHLPRSVEGADGFRTDAAGDFNVPIWQEMVGNQARIATRWHNDPEIDHVIVANDWNTSWRKAWVRREIRKHFPQATWTCQWDDGRLPKEGGTHFNDRVIDFMLTDMDVATAQLMKDDPSSEHRPSRMVALFRAVARKVTRAVRLNP